MLDSKSSMQTIDFSTKWPPGLHIDEKSDEKSQIYDENASSYSSGSIP